MHADVQETMQVVHLAIFRITQLLQVSVILYFLWPYLLVLEPEEELYFEGPESWEQVDSKEPSRGGALSPNLEPFRPALSRSMEAGFLGRLC